MFKLRSESNPKIKRELIPDLGFRDWDELTKTEKYVVWQHLEYNFFDKSIKQQHNGYEDTSHYVFFGNQRLKEIREQIILNTIAAINHLYKIKNYTPTFLEYGNINAACGDFYDIFSKGESNIVLEMLSIYSKLLITATPENHIYKKEDETDDQFEKRKIENNHIRFDKFTEEINNVLGDFGINVYLTREGFIPRQEEKITTEIYEPVIKCLSGGKFNGVDRDLSDAFNDYIEKDYSGSITKAFSALQGFLQIIVNGSTGKGDFSPLIKTAIKNGLIPNDIFTETIFKNIESIISRERMETGDPHPKTDYATEKGAKLILNLTMVFLQHCLQT